MEMIDIGVNLTNKRLLLQAPQVIEEAQAVGVTRMVVTGTSLHHSRLAVELCEKFPHQLVCTAGVHPHDASEWTEQGFIELEALASNDCVRAIGETGLDYNRLFSTESQQLAAFEQQLQLAARLNKPVFLHQRDAFTPFIDLLRCYRDRLVNAVAHCFTDDRAALDALLDLDCHIGITGWVCDERRGQELQRIVRHIPTSRLMLETDAPYLLPRDLQPKPADKTNHPKYLPHILTSVAKLMDLPERQLAEQVNQTSRIFFKL